MERSKCIWLQGVKAGEGTSFYEVSVGCPLTLDGGIPPSCSDAGRCKVSDTSIVVPAETRDEAEELAEIAVLTEISPCLAGRQYSVVRNPQKVTGDTEKRPTDCGSDWRAALKLGLHRR